MHYKKSHWRLLLVTAVKGQLNGMGVYLGIYLQVGGSTESQHDRINTIT